MNDKFKEWVKKPNVPGTKQDYMSRMEQAFNAGERTLPVEVQAVMEAAFGMITDRNEITGDAGPMFRLIEAVKAAKERKVTG